VCVVHVYALFVFGSTEFFFSFFFFKDELQTTESITVSSEVNENSLDVEYELDQVCMLSAISPLAVLA
jgi:hypothetical protein